MTAKVPTSAIGTVTLGITVAHTLRRNTKITITTRAMDSISVNCTSCTEARMVTVRSTTVSTLMEGGMAARRPGMAALMRSTVSMTLAPGCLKTNNWMPRLPFCHPARRAFSGPSTARPTSLTRTGPPLRQARMTLSTSEALDNWSLAYSA